MAFKVKPTLHPTLHNIRMTAISFFLASSIALHVRDVTFDRFRVSNFTFFCDSRNHLLLHRIVWQDPSKLTERDWTGFVHHTLAHRGLHWRLGAFDLLCASAAERRPLFFANFIFCHTPTNSEMPPKAIVDRGDNSIPRPRSGRYFEANNNIRGGTDV